MNSRKELGNSVNRHSTLIEDTLHSEAFSLHCNLVVLSGWRELQEHLSAMHYKLQKAKPMRWRGTMDLDFNRTNKKCEKVT